MHKVAAPDDVSMEYAVPECDFTHAVLCPRISRCLGIGLLQPMKHGFEREKS